MYKVALVQLLNDLAVLLAAVLLFAGAFRLLRRHSGSILEAIRRLESAGAQQLALLGRIRLDAGSPAQRSDSANERAHQPSGLGLTYAEEMRLHAEARQQQEKAILRQIYEQNVRLRAEIAALEG